MHRIEYVIGVDAGGTRTRATCFDATLAALATAEAGPANPNSVGLDAAIDALTRAIRGCAGTRSISAIGLGVAGAADAETRGALARALATNFPGARLHVSTDARIALESTAPEIGGPALVVVAGTGSIALARGRDSVVHRVGGCGFRVGDEGSGAWLGREALAFTARALDGRSTRSALCDSILHALRLDSVHEFRMAAHRAAERANTLAALAPIVSDCAERGDPIAVDLLERAGRELAALVMAVARSANLTESALGCVGGVIMGSARVRDSLIRDLAIHAPAIRLAPLARSPERAAAELACREPPSRSDGRANESLRLVETIHAADRSVFTSLERALPALAAAADAIAARLRQGGRAFYLGAGTSGRLGVLDAAELPPTFGTDPSRWIAIIAGGARAFTEAIEGAEDDETQAAHDLAAHGFSARDALIAIAASGTTPYTLAGIRHARERGALAIAIACVANSPLATAAEFAIELPVGSEVLAGSTRMKAGTSQKIALHTLSTATMNALGLIHCGRMVAMRPTNEKLRRRAVAIVVELTGVDEARARLLLDEVAYELPIALLRARHTLDAATAAAHLARCDGSVDLAMNTPPGSRT